MHLYEDHIYRESTFDERFTFVVFMYMVKYVHEEDRVLRMINHTISHIGKVHNLMTVAGMIREMSKLNTLPMNEARTLLRHGMSLLKTVEHSKGGQYRNREPVVLNQLLGHASDFGLLEELLTPDICETIFELRKLMIPRNILVNIDILSGEATRNLPILRGLINELRYL